MAKELKELYGHEAGLRPQEKGPLATYKEKDDQSFHQITAKAYTTKTQRHEERERLNAFIWFAILQAL